MYVLKRPLAGGTPRRGSPLDPFILLLPRARSRARDWQYQTRRSGYCLAYTDDVF